ncbi:thermonuclease family protein [Methylobacter tundripaludum]|uniref:thermonuclease family protein n=1 Tax=Methylobacter tundripaludum TaxID=173365 RepID=UPI0004DF291D|nr:thermonuclease family protein [Methylobacter tundripaludum]
MKKFVHLVLLLPLTAFSAEWSGTVVGISDGDTLTVLNAQKTQVKIRLAEIDAPESKQAFGTQSKQSLSDICFKKTVVVDDHGTDKYKRTLGRLRCDGVDANAEQVRRGMAWAYRQYLTDQSIADLEATAKSARTGLWADESPVPPWEFRHGGKAAKAKPTSHDKTASSGDSCGSKTKCGEMSSCAEAQHYLNDCGLSRLDRDHDGVPCESICR